MTALAMDGVVLQAEMVAAVRAEIEASHPSVGDGDGSPSTCLATVVVGDNPRCHIFARDKRAAAAEAGMRTVTVDLTGAATQEEVEDAISRLADDPTVHGIFVQLPVSGHVDLDRIIELVPPAKDVDARRGDSPLAPTGAMAVVALLDRYEIRLAGQRVVVVGRVRGFEELLAGRGAQVILTGEAVPDVCRGADILVAAAGRPRTIGPDHVRRGAAVVDVTGDIDRGPVEDVAGAIAPYPAAVGPVAVACLLRNTLTAHRARVPGR
ncbi:MAG TPA: bifunctional 5,10-methylenetetrahydrofolate dehydrogenase/5,10-methenyltetrahydrofolate cyclohydrolase [Acidimicrobiales bacterium]|nr:bifunctional 5,10-methylenetetrahydrofolate dehydrogenase/5,10-methenyltetrahydrofolate cyclohydrolase [Acidimicrobiales bacterium]